MGKQQVWRLLALLGVTVMVMALGAACGAAEEPTATKAAPTAAVATPTRAPIPTVAPSKGEPKYGGILIHIAPRDPPQWDPMRFIYFSGGIADKINGDGNLVKMCRRDQYQVCPGLAESWEPNSDFTQWTFKVRDNIYWHDGKRFTPEDGKFFLELSVKPPKGRLPSAFAPKFDPIRSVEVLEGNRLRITLSEPRPLYLTTIFEGINEIAHPPHLMQPEIDKGNVNASPFEWGLVSVGPYKYLDWDKGSRFRVRKFEKYWEKDAQGRQLPFLDGIDHPIITDPFSAVAALRTGRVDVSGRVAAHMMTTEWMKALKKDLGEKIQFHPLPAAGIGAQRTNNLRAPWTDVRMRKALSLWYDRSGEVATAPIPEFTKIVSMWPSESPFINPDYMTWPGYNPATKQADREEAKRLVAEAGYAKGFTQKMLCNTPWSANCELFEAQLTALGAKVEMVMTDPAGWDARIITADFDVTGGSHNSFLPQNSWPDLDPKNTAARTKHDDPKVKELFDAVFVSRSQEELKKNAQRLERYLLQEAYLLVTTTRGLGVMAARDYVKGLTLGSSGWAQADDAEAWLDK